MATGYPTPNNAIGDIEFSCIPILVPSNSEFEGIFAAAIYGLYAEMSKAWFWREQGTMSPDQAAFLASRGLAITDAYAECGGDMSCIDVADCLDENESITVIQNLITNNQTIINAITQTVNQSGFGNPNSINTSQTTVLDRNPSGALQEEIKTLPDCNLNLLWGGIREGIVGRLNDLTKDLMEDLLIIPDVAERLIVFVDTVPVIGDLIEGVAYNIAEIIPDLYTLYESYESSETLDELACEIFAIVCAECRYPTFEEVFNVYAGHTLIGIDMNNLTLDAVATAVLDLLTQTSEVAFFTLSVQALFVLNLQAAYNGANGTKSIIKWAELGEDNQSDNWLDLCDSCAESYVLWTWDFTTQGQGDFYLDTVQAGQQGIFEAGKGFRAVNYSTGRRYVVAFKFDPTWEVRAVAMKNSNGVNTSAQWVRRPNWGSTSGQQASSAGSAVGQWTKHWEGYPSLTGIEEVYFYTGFTASETAYLEKVSFLFNVGHAPAGNGVPTNDLTPYSSP